MSTFLPELLRFLTEVKNHNLLPSWLYIVGQSSVTFTTIFGQKNRTKTVWSHKVYFVMRTFALLCFLQQFQNHFLSLHPQPDTFQKMLYTCSGNVF